MGKLSRSVSIIGVGYTPLGNVMETKEILNFTEHELYAMASIEAMENAGVEAKDIDAYFVGMVAPNYWAKTMCAAPHFADWVGMSGKPTIFHDEGCGTSAVGLQHAVMAVASGAYDCVLTGGTTIVQSEPRKYMYPPYLRGAYDSYEWWQQVSTGVDQAYDQFGGNTTTAIEGALIQYCQKHKLSFKNLEEAMARFMIVQRNHALTNPKAALVTETYEDEAKRFGFDDPMDYILSDTYNPKIGAILRAKNVGAFVDGAASIIVCATELAHKYTNKKPIEVAGFACMGHTIRNLVEMGDFGKVYRDEFKIAYDMAGIKDPYKEVEYLSVHDCPCSQVMLIGELSGYMKDGDGWKAMMEGRTAFDKERPVQTSGGRTQLGHPVAGASGVEFTEAVNQMRGENGPRQMPKPPKVAVVEGGGQGSNLNVTVLRAL